MSPTSYRLLYPAVWNAKVSTFFGTTKYFYQRGGRPDQLEGGEILLGNVLGEIIALGKAQDAGDHGTREGADLLVVAGDGIVEGHTGQADVLLVLLNALHGLLVVLVGLEFGIGLGNGDDLRDRKSTRLNSSH